MYDGFEFLSQTCSAASSNLKQTSNKSALMAHQRRVTLRNEQIFLSGQTWMIATEEKALNFYALSINSITPTPPPSLALATFKGALFHFTDFYPKNSQTFLEGAINLNCYFNVLFLLVFIIRWCSSTKTYNLLDTKKCMSELLLIPQWYQ